MKSINTARGKYKKIILNESELHQLISYLDLAKGNISYFAQFDLKRFSEKMSKQLKNQKLKLKKDC